ncbi:MAG: DsbA family protein [Phenylobacterium sp.]|uniref:DsbA family protein n=1 Tax=Phenylobacterium sp. TaxID=1871053 RepID=UPI002734D637|nr:DsbA family protein [Phenylobacterium sp.]MDP3746420.1 DsbA family protein [Phenylobacterium sp.]
MLNFNRRLLVVAALGALALAGCSKPAGTPSGDDMTLGDPKAPVKLVEYASLTCSHCATFNAEVFPAFKKKYIDTGKVHYTFKEFLTPPAEVAAAGFLMARCAGKDKYFGVVDSVFNAQQEMFTTGDMRGSLLRVAQSAGMNEQQFNACVSDEAALKALDARVTKSAREQKISATPTFVVNGKVVKEGEMSLAELDAAIAAASK